MSETPSNHFEKPTPVWNIVKETQAIQEKITAELVDTSKKIVADLEKTEISGTRSELHEFLDKFDRSQETVDPVVAANKVLVNSGDLMLKFQRESAHHAVNRTERAIKEIDGAEYFYLG